MTSQIRISNITNLSGTSGATIAGVTSSIGTGYAKIPSGDNAQRVGIESGSIRYNSIVSFLIIDYIKHKYSINAQNV